jgi:2'-5' RNA ligase
MLTQVKLTSLEFACATFVQTQIDQEDFLKDSEVNQGRNVEARQHITLHLGAKSRTDGMTKFIKALPQFSLIIDGLGVFSNEPRRFESDGKEHSWDVLYAQVQDHSGSLEKLHEMLVRESGVPADYPFHPHLTLAYLKFGRAQKYIDKAKIGPWSLKMQQVHFKTFQHRGAEEDKMEAAVDLNPFLV